VKDVTHFAPGYGIIVKDFDKDTLSQKYLIPGCKSPGILRFAQNDKRETQNEKRETQHEKRETHNNKRAAQNDRKLLWSVIYQGETTRRLFD
jgi:hypothetical protein